MSENRPPPSAEDERLNRSIKQVEWWLLLRSAFPLVLAGLGVAGLYTFLATSSEGVEEFWIGVPLGVAGSLCALIGYRGRLREIRDPGEPNARHYPWLFIGWVLVVAGLLVPPYALA
jgi:hypothetical protein